MPQRKTINQILTDTERHVMGTSNRIQSKKIHSEYATKDEEREARAARYTIKMKNAKLGIMGQALIKAGLISE